jgi:catechol 2,3-dioxygenase-like lactoylglutathione lyase family enzyme
MKFQGVVMNVADLDRSIAFYREVLDFKLLSQKDQLAAMGAPGSDRAEVIVLRELGSTIVGGAGHSGLQASILEVDSDDQLELIAGKLDARRALIGRREHSEWTAIVGRDPDAVAVVIAWVPGGMTEDSWTSLDDFLYAVGE